MDLSSIRVLIWDFDGTLYRAIPAFHEVILRAAYRVIMNHTGWSQEKTLQRFNEVYKVETTSSTETAAKLSGISIREAAIECELTKEDRTKFIQRDDKLIALFHSLSSFTHYMLANGIREKILPALSVLGVSEDTFTEIVTSEVVGVTKPAPDGFLYIMQKTGLPAAAHLMIGDREAVDLAPAKALGMKTCLVWSETPSTVADITLPNVYDIEKILGVSGAGRDAVSSHRHGFGG